MHRILLIDDDTRLATLLSEYFTQFGFELESTTLPGQGIALLDNNNYELVILDIMLPEMDGFKVLQDHTQEQRYSHHYADCAW